MTNTIKVALAGAGAFGLKHLDGIKLIDGVEVVSLVGRELDKTQEAAKEIRRRPCDDRTRRCSQAAGPRRRHPRDADSDARRTGDAVYGGRQARSGRDPPRRQPQGRRGRPRDAKADWPRGHVRPHEALQPEPSVRPQAHLGRRVPHPANGCADLFLPPHQHECARPAALVDRPPALASRRPYGRPLRLPVRLADREGERGRGADPPVAWHRDGHEHPAQSAPTGRSARCRCRSTTTGRSAPSSATSATPRPTSPDTTTCSPARTKRST